MPVLSITKNYSTGAVLTKAHLDDAFDSVSTFLNSTKIDSTNIQSGGIAAANLASDSVTTAKIAADAVTTVKILDSAVTTAKINAAAVTAAKLAADAINGQTAESSIASTDEFLFYDASVPALRKVTAANLKAAIDVSASFRANNCATSFTNDLGTETAVYSSADWDTHSAYSTATGVFTAPVAGKYIVTASIGFSASSTGYRRLALYKNGAVFVIGPTSPSVGASAGTVASLSTTVSLAVSDTLTIKPYQNSGGVLGADATSASNSFSAALINE